MVRYSPTGLNGGYQGSGPADLARSLLIAALGDHARCPACAGTTKLACNRTTTATSPTTPAVRQPTTRSWSSVAWHAMTGTGRCPTKFPNRARGTWGNQWRIRRADIQAWLARRGDVASDVPRGKARPTQELSTVRGQVEHCQTQAAEYRAELASVRSELAPAHGATHTEEKTHDAQRLANQQPRHDQHDHPTLGADPAWRATPCPPPRRGADH
ncbi:MAG: DUF6166 domain-containing protein [Pseudonocardiaceae bacterium]